MNLEKEVFDISLNDIMPNRFQPREIFDDNALQELSQSIKEHGVIQPIIVRKVGDKYEIVAGERRFRASQLAEKTTIPAIVKDIDDKETAKIALLENLQRKDLTPIEEARTYQTILKLDNLTQEELAVSLGKSQSTIANKLRLLNLDEEVQTALLNEKISERHARSLLNIENKAVQKELLEKIIINRMTVKQLDDEISRLTGKPVIEEMLKENIGLDQINPANTISDIINNTTLEQKTVEFKAPQHVTNNNDMVEKPEKIESKEPATKNIFDKLRINSEPKEEIKIDTIPTIIPTIETVDTNQSMVTSINSPSQSEYSNIYDLRFAINNVRQAIQNTEKFGFSIEVEEFDFENIYQIVIKIDKNK